MTDNGRKASGDHAGTKGQPALREAALFGLCPPRTAGRSARAVLACSDALIGSGYRLNAQKAGR
ncbi:hypothetical protein AAG594_02660 [Citromicrobium bathyomarinum]